MEKKFVIRNIIMTFIIFIILILVYLIVVSTLPELVTLVKDGNLSEIQNYLRNQSTAEGLLYVGLIQFLQIWTIILSAIPLQFASGVVFDALSTFIVCSISSVLSMSVSFLVWKYLSHIIEKVMPLSEKEEKMISNALNKKASPEFLLFLLAYYIIMRAVCQPFFESFFENFYLALSMLLFSRFFSFFCHFSKSEK